VACGKSVGGLNAVLECQLVLGEYQWIQIEECPEDCKDGTCAAAPIPAETVEATEDVHLPDGIILPDPDVNYDNVQPVDNKPQETDDPNKCYPGQIACADDYSVKTCNWFGNGWDVETCPENKACDLGYCMDVICTPGTEEGKCLGPTAVSVCSSNGVKWDPSYCIAPLTCYKGECLPLQCEPESKICKGMTATQICTQGPDGAWAFVEAETCQGGLCKDGECVGACDVNLKENTYLGCDYYAVDLDNIEVGEFQPVAVVVSVPTTEVSAATITFTDMAKNPPVALSPADLQVDDMVVQPGAVKVFMLPSGHDVNGSVLTTKTFQVTSTSPVTVHQFNPLNGLNVYTNDASLLLPSNAGGKEYFVLSWPLRTQGATHRGLAAVIASQEGTTKVSVWPTAPTLGGPNVPSMAPGGSEPYVYYMNKGDILNIETDGSQGSDLTGTWIKADQKVTVFGGHECANIPLGVDYCDHVEQQLIPLNTWGKHYIGDAFRPRDNAGQQKDTYRLISGGEGVNVTLEPPVAGPYNNLAKGQWVEFQTGTSFQVTATGPVLLGHYMQGSNYQGFVPLPECGSSTGIGDPAFTLAIPVEQYLLEYIVMTPESYQLDFINITFKMGTETQITIDGNPMPQYTAPPYSPIPVGNSGYAVAQVPVTDGVHTIKTTGEDGFGLTAYGYDCDVSYAYPGGLKLATIQ